MVEEPEKGIPGFDQDKNTISFDYIKSNHFRVIRINGAWGGISPSEDQIHMSIYSERWPIPKRTVYALLDKNQMGEEIVEDRVSRNAIVREVEAHLIMSIGAAKRIREWLDEKITNYDKMVKERGYKP